MTAMLALDEAPLPKLGSLALSLSLSPFFVDSEMVGSQARVRPHQAGAVRYAGSQNSSWHSGVGRVQAEISVLPTEFLALETLC